LESDLFLTGSVTEGSEGMRSGTSSAGSNCKPVNEKFCPLGCDPEIFDFVNQCRLLRQLTFCSEFLSEFESFGRYEIDLKLSERQRILNLMLKDEDVLAKKIKLAEKNISCVIQSIDDFYVINTLD
jgi:hypothetical protein